MAQIIDGREVARAERKRLRAVVERLVENGVKPGLAVVLVGDDPASTIYVRKKSRACKKVGLEHFDHRLPASATEQELLSLIDALNADGRVHGVLVQLPLPDQIDASRVLLRIAPSKDVDGFHPHNVGALATGATGFVPCTPLAVVELLRSIDVPMVGANAVVVGRSNIVGKPVAQLLLAEHCTVTIAHSRTRSLDEVVSRADIVVAAVGRPEMIRGSWIKDGAAVIDVGINRCGDRIVGDVEYDAAAARAGAITPVPGGVGPMTIAMLLRNTVEAAKRLDVH